MVPETITGNRIAMLIEILLDRKESGLGIQRIENGLHQQQIHAAFDQAIDRFGVGCNEVVVTDVAEAGIVDIGRQGRRAVGRAEGPGDESRLVGCLRSPCIGTLPREPGCRKIDLADAIFEPVVCLRNAGGVERIGLDDIGAGVEEIIVDRPDDVGSGQDEQVVVALEIVAWSCSPHNAGPR